MHFLFSKISSFFSHFSTGRMTSFFDFRSSLNMKRLGLFLLKIINIFPMKTVFLFCFAFCLLGYFYLLCAIFIVKSIIFIAWGFELWLESLSISRLKGIFLCFLIKYFFCIKYLSHLKFILMSGILPSCIVYNMQPEIILTLKWIKTLLFLCCIYWLLLPLFPF